MIRHEDAEYVAGVRNIRPAPPIFHPEALKLAAEKLNCRGSIEIVGADLPSCSDGMWRPGELLAIDAEHLLIVNRLHANDINLSSLIWHELTHAAQSEKFRTWHDFFDAYAQYPGVLRHNNAFEYEAYGNGDRYRNLSLLERSYR